LGPVDTLLVNLPNIYAAPGSIFIQSEGGISTTELNQKREGKQLLVSDQATINIFNYLPFGMVVNDAIVRDNRTLAQVNGESVTLQPGNVFLNNVAIGNENTDVKPATISITQKEIFPTSRFDVDVPDVPNELFIVGDVINENGGVAIRNFDDNINVTGNVRGEPVEIFAAGDFSLNVDGWFHTNRDPRQYLDFQSLQGSGKVKPVETEANPIKLNDPKRANFNNASLVVDNIGTTLQQSIFRDNATAGASIFGATEELKPGRILSLGNIAITANNLNVNGLIQSGVQNIELTIDQSFINSGPNTGFKAFLDDQGNIRNGITFGDDVPIEGYYDAEQQAIIVEDLVPAGGSITLAGRLLSTGNAQLKVAHGYAGIDINNNTDKKLILNTIDNTENRVGKITLIDTARLVNGSITQFKTEYDVTDQGISRQDFTGQLADQVVTDPEGGTTTLKRIQYTTMGQASSVLQAELTKPNPTKVTWAPEAGLFYVWIEGQENTRTIETTYEKNSFNLFGFDTPLARDIADALDKDNSWTERKITYTDDFPLLESEDRVFQTSQVIPPGIAANTIYYVEFERRVDTLVDVIPNSTIVKYVGTDTSKGEKDALYLYKGSVAVELYLPEVNYTTADWEKVTSGVPEYNSDYKNSTYTVKPSVSGGGWLQKKQEITKITDIQGQKDYFTQALKADYPIEVLYGTPVDKPTIDIDSQGTVQLNGNVFNPASGVIEITSTAGSVETSSQVAIYGTSPTIDAAGNVNVNVEGVSESETVKGPLNVTAGGDIVVKGVKSSDDANKGLTGQDSRLLVDTIRSTVGNVYLDGAAGIQGDDAGSIVAGGLVELSAINGSIGGKNNDGTLTIDSSVTAGGAGLAARANGNISITEATGSLNLVRPDSWDLDSNFIDASVVSTTGEVILKTLSGSILDGYEENFFERPSQQQVANLNAQQALSGQAAEDAALSGIRSEEIATTRAYHTYFDKVRGAQADFNNPTTTLQVATLAADDDTLTFSRSHGLATGDHIFFEIGLALNTINFAEDSTNWTVVPAGTQANYDLAAITDGERTAIQNGEVVNANDTLYRYNGPSVTQTNLANRVAYYAIVTSDTSLRLASTREQALYQENSSGLDLQVDNASGTNIAASSLRVVQYAHTTNDTTIAQVSGTIAGNNSINGTTNWNSNFAIGDTVVVLATAKDQPLGLAPISGINNTFLTLANLNLADQAGTGLQSSTPRPITC
jgi:hypothetical protein